MTRKRGIIWFRSDLRLHDNEALVDAHKTMDEILPLYVLDERWINDYTKHGFRKMGPLRAKFLLESLSSLRSQLRKFGSDLVIRVGKPEEVVYEIAKEVKSSWVFCNRERTEEELKVQDRLENNLWSIGQELRYSRGKMLYYTQDLPFPITQSPDVFASFRKEVERIVSIRPPLELKTEDLKPILVDVDPGEIPTLEDLGYQLDKHFKPMLGGELIALEHLQNFKNDFLMGKRTKSCLSPYLSHGCLSPKTFYHTIDVINLRKHKSNVTELKRNLMLRDYHRLIGKKHINKIFQHQGLQEVKTKKEIDMDLLLSWVKGETDHDYVNACMKELWSTGYLSNRKRRVAAYYLLDELNQNWLAGAEYFESVLLDYDPCSNYGNWQRSAGISLDQKGESPVNFENLESKADPNRNYINQWKDVNVDATLFLRP